MKFFSKLTSAISVNGVALKVEKVAGGFVVEVEDGFQHVKELLTHGFKVMEEDVGDLLRRRSSGAPPTPTQPPAGSQSEADPAKQPAETPPAQP